MPDDPTTGEVFRRFRDHEQRSEVKHAALDDRITHVAEAALQAAVYSSDQRARDAEIRLLQDEIRQLRADMRQEHRDREAEEAERVREVARNKRLMMAAFVSPLALLLVQVWLSSKGAG